MRNVISLNKNWAFIQENAGLPGEMQIGRAHV